MIKLFLVDQRSNRFRRKLIEFVNAVVDETIEKNRYHRQRIIKENKQIRQKNYEPDLNDPKENRINLQIDKCCIITRRETYLTVDINNPILPKNNGSTHDIDMDGKH